MSIYAWLGETPSAFELRLRANTVMFASPYSTDTQTLDLQGERWVGMFSLPPAITQRQVRQREAFFDRFKGTSHQVEIWHFAAPQPLGTIGATAPVSWTGAPGTVAWTDGSGGPVAWTDGTPVVVAAVAQFANTALLQVLPGATVLAGDMLGLAGQTVRVMADATADSAGRVTVEFQPRARRSWAAYSPVVTDRPRITVMLKDGGVPTTWQPGRVADGCSVEFVEVP
ncbi:hypothetical protein [Aquabacterium sp. OR-4]|uniref:hypothetical protein n=1 Tax=Aquabacterium sp. OR-4 TaxID=2978127 RepID=UPI0021B2AF96|nr:hypothetical protein [Aquabacterium sp. OR-4]MDT7836451.1 hypothetical protein [Aquabacterium sp. OR-4]